MKTNYLTPSYKNATIYLVVPLMYVTQSASVRCTDSFLEGISRSDPSSTARWPSLVQPISRRLGLSDNQVDTPQSTGAPVKAYQDAQWYGDNPTTDAVP